MTNEKNVTLLILVADCLPVFFYDPVHQAIGLAHAGWRGTVTHIAPKTLLAMSEAYGTQPAEVKVALGPSIGACCYEVGQEVKGQFDEIFPWSGEVFTPSFGKQWKLDLAQANVKQLSGYRCHGGPFNKVEPLHGGTSGSFLFASCRSVVG